MQNLMVISLAVFDNNSHDTVYISQGLQKLGQEDSRNSLFSDKGLQVKFSSESVAERLSVVISSSRAASRALFDFFDIGSTLSPSAHKALSELHYSLSTIHAE